MKAVARYQLPVLRLKSTKDVIYYLMAIVNTAP